jgi:prepilin-type N-terminal cleavage/methylation domain-containing protein
MTRRGMTLIELIVVLAILGITAGISSVAVRAVARPSTAGMQRQFLSLRSEAIRRGAPQTRLVRDSSEAFVATALADGRLLVDSSNTRQSHVAP